MTNVRRPRCIFTKLYYFKLRETLRQITAVTKRGTGTWDVGRGDSGTWGRGDSGTRGLGDSGTRGRGDSGTRGRGDSGTWGRGDTFLPFV